MLDDRTAFKVAFLAKCAQAGLSMEEIEVKVAGLTDLITEPYKALVSGAKNLASTSGTLGAATLLAGPPIAGAALGYGAAKLTDLNDENPDETKIHELISEYNRLGEQARVNRELRTGKLNAPRSGRPLI